MHQLNREIISFQKSLSNLMFFFSFLNTNLLVPDQNVTKYFYISFGILKKSYTAILNVVYPY